MVSLVRWVPWSPILKCTAQVLLSNSRSSGRQSLRDCRRLAER